MTSSISERVAELKKAAFDMLGDPIVKKYFNDNDGHLFEKDFADPEALQIDGYAYEFPKNTTAHEHIKLQAKLTHLTQTLLDLNDSIKHCPGISNKRADITLYLNFMNPEDSVVLLSSAIMCPSYSTPSSSVNLPLDKQFEHLAKQFQKAQDTSQNWDTLSLTKWIIGQKNTQKTRIVHAPTLELALQADIWTYWTIDTDLELSDLAKEDLKNRVATKATDSHE